MRVLENILFVAGLLMLIPPVPSDAGMKYGFFPLAAAGMAFFAVSRTLAVKRGGEAWLFVAIQTAGVLFFSILMRDRAQMFH